MTPERAFVRNFRRKFHALEFHAFPVEHEALCRCGEPRRPNGKNCHECHAQAQREYRARETQRRRESSPLAVLARRHMRQA